MFNHQLYFVVTVDHFLAQDVSSSTSIHSKSNPCRVIPAHITAFISASWRQWVEVMAIACITLMAAGSLRAAPIYVLKYAFTNFTSADALNGNSFTGGNRAVAGINDAGDVCGTFMTSNVLDNSTQSVSSVYLLRTNGEVFDLFPRGVSPAVTGADANHLTQRRADGSVQIVGSVLQADGYQRGAIWNVASNGTISSFFVLTNLVWGTNMIRPGEEQSYGEANDINDSGMVVGDGNSAAAEGVLTWLPPYSTSPSYEGWNDYAAALAVNDQGAVLVNADFRTDLTPYYYEGAALVRGGSPTELPPGGTNSVGDCDVYAFAMAGSTVVGQANFGTNDYNSPFAWDQSDAALTPLSAPVGKTYGFNCEADSVNTNGGITGYVTENNTYSSPSFYTLWKPGTNGNLKVWNAYALDDLLPTQPGFHTLTGYSSPKDYDIAINDHNDIALHAYAGGYGGQDAIQVYEPVNTGIVQFFNTNGSDSSSCDEFYAAKSDGAITASVELVRADGYTAPVTVHFATSDADGVAGKDYIATNGDLTWGVGESGAKAITIQLITNNFEYGDRTFYLDLSSPSGAEIGLNHAVMYIYNYDNEMLDFVNGSPAEYGDYAVQAGASNVVITLRRDYSPDGTMMITNVVTYDYGAVAGVDYQGFTNTTPITWGPGQPGSISFSIPLLDTTNLYSPISFSVEAQGTINATNSLDTWTSVDILPLGQTPSFQFDTTTPLLQGNALQLTSLVEEGVTVDLQSSTNLVDWKTVGQITCTNGLVQFNPAMKLSSLHQFYRAIVQ